MSSALAANPSPLANPDGTLTAVVDERPSLAGGVLSLALALPKRLPAERVAGRYFLARCGAQSEQERAAQWSIYLRRPLFVAAQPQILRGEDFDLWRFTALGGEDEGYQWLAARSAGEPLNLFGPFGNGFPLQPLTRRLLLIADTARLPRLRPLLDEALDRGSQVSLLVLERQDTASPAEAPNENPRAVDAGAGAQAGAGKDVEAMRTRLPLAVELHFLHNGIAGGEVDEILRWSDQVCAALPSPHLLPLAEAIRRTHIRFDAGYAFTLVDADLACGFGACLACVVPLANGSLTRACVHGPVFDLLELAGRG
jgi:dihydroorotate dehydrogenase electron transfer subunit